jgi:hypothetical protein
MNADELIDNIKFIADKQYEGEPAQNRLAYHVGLLESHLRQFIQTCDVADQYIKKLQMQLIAKDSE